jgi:hypothetical protein
MQHDADFVDVWVMLKGIQRPINYAPPQQWVPLFWQSAARAGTSSCSNNDGGDCHVFRPLIDV